MAVLKVYRTPIGFHDAYVAAPSKKAALRAWGSDADLFARGVAELVTDPALTAEPLARPGEVVKRSRGTAAEQLAALPPDRPKGKPSAPKKTSPRSTAPKPDRDAVDAAEQAVAAAEKRQAAEARALAREEEALAERRRDMRVRHDAENAELDAARRKADAAYAEALRAWREGQ